MKQPCDEAVIRSAAPDAPVARESRPWILAATILGSSLAFIDSTAVNVALPALQSSLHATVVDIQWVVESYGLFLSALILIGGALGDSIGRRRMFVLGVGLFACASILCGLSSSISQLIVARCIQGVGAAALVPSSLAIISGSFDEQSRGRAIGTWSGFTSITSAIGPVIGGWLVEHASWHWVFFINIPLAIAVIAISLRYVPRSHKSDAQPIDWLGALTVTLGLAGLVYGILESATSGWRNPRVAGSLILGLGLLILFIAIERRVAAPMVPLSLFKSRSFSGTNLMTLFLYAALGIFIFLLPLNLIQIQRYSPAAAGASILPMILLSFFLSRWSGGLVARYGARLPLVVGPLITAAGFVLFALPSVDGNYWSTFFPAFVVLGTGMAVSVAPLTTVVMNSVALDRAGAASGINNAVARVAGVFAVAILGIAMVEAFGFRLNQSLASLHLSSAILRDIQSNLVKLGGLDVPSSADAQTAALIRSAIVQAFIFAFRVVMALCAALAVASAAVAARMIPAAASRIVSNYTEVSPNKNSANARPVAATWQPAKNILVAGFGRAQLRAMPWCAEKSGP
jgi:EmrB/QacA subfamily drug resistance transporter